jgi:hypothetical protein
MPTEAAPKNALVAAFDAYKDTEEARDMMSLIPVSKPSAILFMAFSAGWAARRDGSIHRDSFCADSD